MAVSSMTGYASAEGVNHDVAWLWECRSVNGKGLDLRMRVPTGYAGLEQKLRRQCADRFVRGNMQISLTVQDQGQSVEYVLNQPVLDQVLAAAAQLAQQPNVEKASIDGLLNIRGVLEERKIEQSEDVQREIVEAIEGGYLKALEKLEKTRQEEGAALAGILKGQIVKLSEFVSQLVDDPSRTTDALRARLKAQVDALIEANTNFDEERLHQEAAILATKADLQEEIDRLLSHIDAANALLEKGGPIGRRLDFLAQELNRESNTVCSKSNAPSVTAIGLELKVLIDQFREQIQNVE